MSKRLTTEEFIKRARTVHGDKYDYSLTVYEKATIPVWIICPVHGPFLQRPNDHLNGYGCKKCGIENRIKKMSKTTEEFIEEARLVHGDKYDYSLSMYKNNHTELDVICHVTDEDGNEHGVFHVRPTDHIIKQTGCPKCAGNIKKTTEQFIKEARQIHGDKYDYSQTDYEGNHEFVKIGCPIHGYFLQRPIDHLRGHGCTDCAKELKSKKQRKAIVKFVEDSRRVHGDKYDYSLVKNYKNNKTEVPIICHEKGKNGIEHGVFWKRPDVHITQGQGCPKCVQSHMEAKVSEILANMCIQYVQWKRFAWLGLQSVDFYLPDYHIAIECQGIQHYQPVDFAGKGLEWAEDHLTYMQVLDEKKKQLCEENNLPLYYIRYDEDIETAMKQILAL